MEEHPLCLITRGAAPHMQEGTPDKTPSYPGSILA